MHPRTANIPLQHLRILQRIMYQGIWAKRSLTKLWHEVDGCGNVYGLDIGYLIWNELGKAITLREGELLHSCHILNSTLSRHRTIGHDMCYSLVTVLLRYPPQYIRSPVIIKVHINIRHRDTVRIEETLKQEVVANRVNIRNV